MLLFCDRRRAKCTPFLGKESELGQRRETPCFLILSGCSLNVLRGLVRLFYPIINIVEDCLLSRGCRQILRTTSYLCSCLRIFVCDSLGVLYCYFRYSILTDSQQVKVPYINTSKKLSYINIDP